MSSLYKKLLEVQKRVIGLGKDKKSFGYDYVTGAKVLEHIKPILNECGILLKQEIVSVERERIDYKAKSGEKSEMLYSVYQKFTWIDAETGERDENTFFSSGMNDWEKGLGSALTYAERYFLLKYFHIATDEDDIDNEERKKDIGKTEPKKEAVKENLTTEKVELITPEQIKAVHTLITKTKTDFEKVKEYYKVNSSKELTKKQAAELIDILSKKVEEDLKHIPQVDDVAHTLNTERN